MPRKSGAKFMIAFVQDYLDGVLDRLDWDLDFNHYLIKHYPKMERDNADLAECFVFYLAEEGFDQAIGLSNDDHKSLIQEQFDKFNSAMQDGFS